MAKEQDLQEELLRASPLLNTFLNYTASDRAEHLQKILDLTAENIRSTSGEDFLRGALFASVDIFAFLDIFPTEQTELEPNEIEIGSRVLLFLCLGFELGSSSNNFQDVNFFVEGIAKKAVEKNIIRESKEFSADQIVNGMLITGFTLAQGSQSSLGPFSDFVEDLD